ncbi:hypothetical protein CHS0354_018954 [Potamilus streckersoni]|uniref:Uncharacterized protein n=1 Tax=Potamilus streckersoni TaxID=2493646 RepID=A0AAE0T7E0_9BIVA|nr:hypothetical protein CHS0354_018954 [Potamilus streckersoni]
MEEDTGSWKERCERYFTSMTDLGGKENSPDTSGSSGNQKHENDEDKQWKNLAELPGKQRNIKLFNEFKRWFSVLDIHGARYGGKTPNTVEFLMWCIIAVAAFGALSFTVYIQVSDSFSSPRHFQTSEITEMRPSEVIPNITICNVNILKKSRLTNTRFNGLLSLEPSHFNQSQVSIISSIDSVKRILHSKSSVWSFLSEKAGAGLSDILLTLGEDYLIGTETTNLTNFQLAYNVGLRGDLTTVMREFVKPTENELSDFGHRREETLLECWIDGRRCRDNEISDVQDPILGNCITIRPSKDSVSDTLKVTLHAQKHEYVDVLSPTVGFHVFVHANGTIPRSGQNDFISATTATQMKIKQTKITDVLNAGCQKDKQYDKFTCEQNCLETLVQTYCECSHYSFSSTLSQCFGFKYPYTCLRALQELAKLKKTECNCPIKCRTIEFEVNTRSSVWPTDGFVEHLQENLIQNNVTINISEIRNSLVKLSINIGEGKVIEIQEQTSFSILDLLARIGGLSAFIAGVSIITVGELIWTVARLIWFCSINLRNNSSMKSDNMTVLTDSEITSVTWAMYKERRREEIKMGKAKHQPGITVSGNAQSRIHMSRKNAYLAPITEENHQRRTDVQVKEGELHNHPWERTGHTRLYSNVISERPRGPGEYNTPERRGNISNTAPISAGLSDHTYVELLHLNGLPKRQPSGAGQTNSNRDRSLVPVDATLLYGGSSAYYNSKNVLEPTYI